MLESGLFDDLLGADYSVVTPETREKIKLLLGFDGPGSTRIHIPALPRVSEAVAHKYCGLGSVRDLSPTRAGVLTLVIPLEDGEDKVFGAVCDSRLAFIENQLGLSQALWLAENRDRLPRWFRASCDRFHTHFPATVVTDQTSGRHVPYFRTSFSPRREPTIDKGRLGVSFRSFDRIACFLPETEESGNPSC